jgi:hypothetical protein
MISHSAKSITPRLAFQHGFSMLALDGDFELRHRLGGMNQNTSAWRADVCETVFY